MSEVITDRNIVSRKIVKVRTKRKRYEVEVVLFRSREQQPLCLELLDQALERVADLARRRPDWFPPTLEDQTVSEEIKITAQVVSTNTCAEREPINYPLGV